MVIEMKRYTVVVLLLVGLSGCLGPQIKPSAYSVSENRSIIVIPVEPPPLEVTPDLALQQQPGVAMLSETVPLSSILDRRIYRGPGGVLIFGFVTENDFDTEMKAQPAMSLADEAASFDDVKTLAATWMPTLVLAQQTVSQLSSGRAVKAILSDRYYKLPIAHQKRTAHLESWGHAIRGWYNQETSVIDYRQLAIGPVDAVLEVGLGGYSIWAEQTELQVLMKLIDPKTKQVLGRTRNQVYPTLGSPQELLDHDAGRFKQLVTQIGAQLINDNLRYFGMLSE